MFKCYTYFLSTSKMRALTGGRYAHAIDSFLHLPRVIREECDQYVPCDTLYFQ